MLETSYYVYALKDPRVSPAKPFYIGKGTGTRAFDHLIEPDDSRKGRRIRDIVKAGKKVLVVALADGLSEIQAIKIEAELIAAFGTETNGGLLTNVVIPSGNIHKVRKSLVVPDGVLEKAQLGLALLKRSVFELVKANPNGVTNSDTASALGIKSDYGGGSKDYLSYSVLGLLMREGKISRQGKTKLHIAQVD